MYPRSPDSGLRKAKISRFQPKSGDQALDLPRGEHRGDLQISAEIWRSGAEPLAACVEVQDTSVAVVQENFDRVHHCRQETGAQTRRDLEGMTAMACEPVAFLGCCTLEGRLAGFLGCSEKVFAF